MKSNIKPILDRQLSQLDWTPEETHKLLRQMRGEAPVKKRLSFALVLAITLALVAATAVAATLWKNYHEQIAKNEGTIGYFDTWTGQQRADFVLSMQQEGIDFDAAQVAQLQDKGTTDQQKKEIATRLVTEKYGIREDVVTAISILEAERGPLPGWSLEEKAAYTQLLVKTGTLGADEEMYWLPGPGDIPQEKAVEVARKAVMDKFGATAADLDKLRVNAELRSFAHEREARNWYIGFSLPESGGYDPAQYDVWMDAANGEVQSCEDTARKVAESAAKAPPPEAEDLFQGMIQEYHQAAPFTTPKLMELQKAWAPKMEKLKPFKWSTRGMMGVFANLMAQELRLPAEGDLPMDKALERAREAVLVQPGWTREKLDMYELYAQVSYQSKELGKPVYQFFFNRHNVSDPRYDDPKDSWAKYERDYLNPLYALFGGDNASTPLYVSVRVDAVTGEPTDDPQIVLPSLEGPPLEFTLLK